MWPRRGRPDAEERTQGRVSLPEGVRVPDPGRGEQTLALAQDDHTGSWLVLTSHRVLVLDGQGRAEVDRPWHEVDTGAWDPETMTLSLSWVGGSRGLQWQVRTSTGPGRVPEVFWERVQASVVLVRKVDLGPRRTTRVSIRKVLADRELVDQVLPGRGVRPDDSALNEAVETARRDLRDQVGLPPVARP